MSKVTWWLKIFRMGVQNPCQIIHTSTLMQMHCAHLWRIYTQNVLVRPRKAKKSLRGSAGQRTWIIHSTNVCCQQQWAFVWWWLMTGTLITSIITTRDACELLCCIITFVLWAILFAMLLIWKFVKMIQCRLLLRLTAKPIGHDELFHWQINWKQYLNHPVW